MNADGNNLPVEERRKLRIEEEARRAAEIREGVRRRHFEVGAQRKLSEYVDEVRLLEALLKARDEGGLPPTVPTEP